VRCNGNKAWKMYVPVEVSIHETILVARHPLPRGHLLDAGDLVSDERDVSRMNSGYILRTEALIGQRLRQAVLAGRAFTMQLIEADKVVSRGQTVTLSISAAGMTIRMAGKALMDGALAQRIRVENLNSGRVIEGIVRSPELVEILPPTAAARRPMSRNSFHAKPKVSPIPVDTELSNNDR
jgi:flagella basal body P-ring formation protein FlgA